MPNRENSNPVNREIAGEIKGKKQRNIIVA
jgi:hypothetical protein